jgi:very-short-patch-repair endonuclease
VHSNLEWRYVGDVERAHRLLVPRRQARTVRAGRSQYCDTLYEEFGVLVELDGSAAHLVEDRWRDIHRDNFSARSGIITLRFSWADITCRACTVAAEISDVLRLRGWDGMARSCGPRCTITASPIPASNEQASNEQAATEQAATEQAATEQAATEQAS